MVLICSIFTGQSMSMVKLKLNRSASKLGSKYSLCYPRILMVSAHENTRIFSKVVYSVEFAVLE